MKRIKNTTLTGLILLTFFGCGSENENMEEIDERQEMEEVEDLADIISNSHLNNSFLALAREVSIY